VRKWRVDEVNHLTAIPCDYSFSSTGVVIPDQGSCKEDVIGVRGYRCICIHSLLSGGFEGRDIPADRETMAGEHFESVKFDGFDRRRAAELEAHEPDGLSASSTQASGPFAHRGSRRLLFGGLNSGLRSGSGGGTSFGSTKATYEGPAPQPQCTCQKSTYDLPIQRYTSREEFVNRQG